MNSESPISLGGIPKKNEVTEGVIGKSAINRISNCFDLLPIFLHLVELGKACKITNFQDKTRDWKFITGCVYRGGGGGYKVGKS